MALMVAMIAMAINFAASGESGTNCETYLENPMPSHAICAVRLTVNSDHPQRKPHNGPYASRRNTYWPPVAGSIAPSSAYASAAKNDRTPAAAHTSRMPAAEGTFRATTPGTRKIPPPITVPASSEAASSNVRRRGRSGDACNGTGLAIMHELTGASAWSNKGVDRRRAQDMEVSSLGIGTYLGEADDATDECYVEAIVTALKGGINLIDTSLNYRHQRSELAVARALSRWFESGGSRSEVVVCTKAGYLVQRAVPENLRQSDVVGKVHSLAPQFLDDQLERSRANLHLDTIDVFYIHNPETQLPVTGEDEFYQRMRGA